MSFLNIELKKAVREFLNIPISKIDSKEEKIDVSDYEDIDNIIEPIIDSDKMYYIHDDDLPKKIAIDRDLSKPIKLNFAFYKIIKLLERPFVVFYFNKNNKAFQTYYEFIEKETNPDLFKEHITNLNESEQLGVDKKITDETEPPVRNIIDIRSNKLTGGGEGDIEQIYLEECNKIINDNIKQSDLEKGGIITEYKGFEEIEELNSIYAFFEKKDDSQIELSSNSCFAIIDDIIKKNIINIPVSEPITRMFTENPDLLYMKDENDEKIDIPISVYLCKKSGSSYVNVDTYDSDSSESLDNEFIIHHDIFGDVYLFTIEPIGSVLNIFTPSNKRFALFVENDLVIDNSIEIAKYISNHPEKNTTFSDYKCISFMENGNKYWAVKSKLLFTEITM